MSEPQVDQPTAPCPNCGAGVPHGAVFCPVCGHSLSGPVGGPRPVPQNESRNWAMGAHGGALVGALLGGLPAFVAPLVVWLVRREVDPFAAEHGREALNFNLTVIILAVASVVLALPLGIVTLGIGLIVMVLFWTALGILWLVWTIQALMAASRGQPYRYPLTLRMVQA